MTDPLELLCTGRGRHPRRVLGRLTALDVGRAAAHVEDGARNGTAVHGSWVLALSTTPPRIEVMPGRFAAAPSTAELYAGTHAPMSLALRCRGCPERHVEGEDTLMAVLAAPLAELDASALP